MPLSFDTLARLSVEQVNAHLAEINAHEHALAVVMEYVGTPDEGEACRALGAVGRRVFTLAEERLQVGHALDAELARNGPAVRDLHDRWFNLSRLAQQAWSDFVADWAIPD